MSPPKVFFDLNVLVSAAARFGAPRQCFDLAITGAIVGATAEHCLTRLSEILHYKFHLDVETANQAQETFARILFSVRPPDTVPSVTGDTEDDVVLASAVLWGADYLVSGDRRHLLPLKQHEGVLILSPRELLEIVRAEP